MQDFNFHNHTYRCCHADPDLTEERVVQEHITHGLKHVAITDHYPWKTFVYREGIRKTKMDREEMPQYLEAIAAAKEKYASVIKVWSGFEIEYMPDYLDEIKETRQLVDLLVLGQHYAINRRTGVLTHLHDTSMPFGAEELNAYCECVEEGLSTGLFDILAHPDLFMIRQDTFGPEEEAAARRIFAAAEKYDMPVEINLSHLARAANGMIQRVSYPSAPFWAVAKDYHVRAVYGVDYHLHLQMNAYEESIRAAEALIGGEALSHLHFCTADEVIEKRRSRNDA